MARTTWWSLLAGIALLGTVGCAPAGEPRPEPTVGPLVEARCPRDDAGMLGQDVDPYAGSLPPEGFVAVTAVRCVDDLGHAYEKGKVVYTIRESTTAVSPALLTALALPDEGPLGWHEACPANARSVLYLLLVNADGLAYHPQTPITPCHDPRPEVEQAVADLPWRWRATFEVKLSA